jgi:hypothetical protein
MLKVGEKIYISTEDLLEGSRVVGLEANTEKTKYMANSRHQNLGENYNLLATNKSSENVTKFRCLGIKIAYTNKLRAG